MSQIDKLDYEAKTNAVAITNRPTQATAEDFNEIKEVVNNCVDGVNWIKSDEAVLAAGDCSLSRWCSIRDSGIKVY
jgi:hypothetical protein